MPPFWQIDATISAIISAYTHAHAIISAYTHAHAIISAYAHAHGRAFNI